MKNDYFRRAEKILAFFQKTGSRLNNNIKAEVIGVHPESRCVSILFTVNEASLNTFDIMHGGMISWLADNAMAVAISTYGGEAFGSTANMSVDFIRPLPLGTKVEIKAYSVNPGGFLRRARAEFYIGNDIVASATGNYTGKKMLGEFRLGCIDSKTSRVEDDFVRFFLLEGTEKSLVIDSGVSGLRNVKKLAEDTSGLPAILINTHADSDHIAGNKDFSTVLMHEGDKGIYEQKKKELPLDAKKRIAKPRFVKDGDIIDLGNRPIEVIHIPGHTPGSIGLLDINNRVLYAGDSIQDGEIYMFGIHRNMDDYIVSLEKLNAVKNRFDIIRSSHNSLELNPVIIGKLIKAAKTVRSGKVQGETRTMYGSEIRVYDMGCATFLCDK